MRKYIRIICITAVVFFALAVGYSQENNGKLDSLKKVLLMQQEDSDKVNTLLALSTLETGVSTLDYANAALSIAEKINFIKGRGKALYSIGRYYYLNNRYLEAIQNGLKSLAIMESQEDKRLLANIHSLLNASYGMHGNYSENLYHAYAALKLWEEMGDKSAIAAAFNDLGNIYASHENYEEAFVNAQKSLQISRENGFKSNIAYSLGILGSVNFKNGKLEEALANNLEAIQILKDVGESAYNYYAQDRFRSIGGIYQKQGDLLFASANEEEATQKFLLAKANYLKALQYDQLNNLESFMAIEYLKLSDIAIRLHQNGEASIYLQQALKISKSVNFKDGVSNSYYGLAQLDSLRGNYRQAYDNYKMYIVYRDSLSNEEVTKKNVATKMQYEFDKKELRTKTDQDKKDAEAGRIKNQQYLAISVLAVVVLAVLTIALIQYKHSKQKQEANELVTRQKKKVESALVELRATQDQLIQSEKMASLGELTAGIAHEIQNPLNFVNNFADVNKELVDELKAAMEAGDTEEAILIANDIKTNEEKISLHGKRADAIVRSMLQHSRRSTGQKELTDINALADEYLRLGYHGMRAKDKNFNAILQTDFDTTIGKLNFISQDISRVILNLVNNAFYAVDEKARKQSGSYVPTVSVSTKKLNHLVQISVKDNGNGMAQKIMEKIFQPFFTTKPTGQGTGLGLSLSYDIVKAHGGEIKVESTEDEGTEFTIQLPLIT